jgi:serine/threonine-protein kinase
MAEEQKTKLRLEIAHILFIDMVGYSKLLIDEQSDALRELNQIIRNTEAVREAEAAKQLIRLPTGDGMALVFTSSAEAPVECALQITQALRDKPGLPLRMGIHSGPVHHVADVNERTNIAGAGINIAQRVMDCGDAGHILLSKHVADDLEQYRQWRPFLHDLGECEVKHGARVFVVNLYTQELGNAEVPEKFKGASVSATIAATKEPRGKLAIWSWTLIGAVIVVTAAIAGFYFLSHRPNSKASFSATPAIPDKSIAVLPFENLSDDKQNAFFTDGVQDEILTHLAKIADLKVISRTSVMRYKSGVARNLQEIGQALGVAHLLEGSVQRAANRVRVNAQLIDARTDTHLWGQTYDRDLADVFGIQSEIAKAIADQLQARLSPSEKAAIQQPPTVNLAAFDLYTRAKTLLLSVSFSTLARNNLLQAVDLLNQATSLDPNFLLAYCQLAKAHDQLYFLTVDHTAGRLAAAETAVKAALRLRPDSGEAHLALAEHRYRAYLDYDGARTELAFAQRALPNEPVAFELLGYIERRQGRWDESTQNLKRAIELDPHNIFTLQQIALSYSGLGRYEDMATALDRALAIAPKDTETRVARAQVDLLRRADPRSSHAEIDAILAENPAEAPTMAGNWLDLALCERDLAGADRALVALSTNTYGPDAMAFTPVFARGLIARVRGDTAAAQIAFKTAREEQEQVVREQPDYAPAICLLGLIDAALGRKDDALREGRRALDLLPAARDAIGGSDMAMFFAIICAWTGEKDLALAQLKAVPLNSFYVTYGNLKLHPFWDPLRGDPRFEKIVASLTPK